MKTVYKMIGLILTLSIFLSNTAETAQAKGKDRLLNKKDRFCVKVTDNEWFDYNDYEGGEWNVYRNDYGLVAKNVKKVWTRDYGDNVYISQKKDQAQEVDFSHWTGKGNTSYRASLVSKDAVELYPINACHLVWRNSKGKYFETRVTNSMNGKILEAVKNKRIHALDGVEKCWCGDQEMFACIKDNSLKLRRFVPTGPSEETEEIRTYFEGKGDQIKQVVASTGDDMDTARCIFVLMKDGSVWGMGNNRYKMLGKEGSAEQFNKIIEKDVKQIQAGTDRVAMLKKDKSLWVWGKTMQKANGRCSEKPVKVADNVKEFSLAGEGRGDCRLLMLKTDHTAYGLGGAEYEKIFTKSHPKKWYVKPVRLMKNVKHVYANSYVARTMLLTRKNELYWTGHVLEHPLYAVWAGGKKWDMPKYYTSQDLYNKINWEDKYWKWAGME